MSSEPMSTMSTAVDTSADMSVHQGGLTPGQRTPTDTRSLAVSAAFELLRTALLCKLAVDLEDAPLARRAARHATTHGRLLSGLDFPPHADDQDDDELPEVDDLLERLPSRREVQRATADERAS